MTASMSEEFSSAKAGSNRSFGVVFVVAFALIGLFPLVREEAVRTWALLVSDAFLVPTPVYPQVLIMYALVMVPVGLILKLMRKDLLRLKPDARASTYWIQRTPPGPTPESLKDQF